MNRISSFRPPSLRNRFRTARSVTSGPHEKRCLPLQMRTSVWRRRMCARAAARNATTSTGTTPACVRWVRVASPVATVALRARPASTFGRTAPKTTPGCAEVGCNARPLPPCRQTSPIFCGGPFLRRFVFLTSISVLVLVACYRALTSSFASVFRLSI